MRRTAIVLALILTAAAMPAFAQKTARVAIVDLERIFTALSQEKTIKREMQQMINEAKSKIDRVVSDIQKLEQKIRTDTTLTATRVRELQLDIQVLEQDLSRIVEEQEERLLEREDEIKKRLLRDIQEATASIAKKRKADIVIERREATVLFADPQFDITDEVIELMKKTAEQRARQ